MGGKQIMADAMDISEARYNAELAYSNQNYETALKYYQIVLNQNPADLQALSRAGAVAVVLKKYKDALNYFAKAKEVDPDNGDNYFNYGNACFFNSDYVGALDSYVEAEKRKCSEDVLPRMYYQMALLFSSRQETDNALIYLRKCEKADSTGMIALTKEFISEKLKIYMINRDYVNAEKSAAQLVAVDPTVYRNYAVYFSLLMASKDYDTAVRVLDDAEEYAVTGKDELVSISLQRAAVEAAQAENDPANRDAHYAKAIEALSDKYADPEITKLQIVQLAAEIGDLYFKSGKYDEAISWTEGHLKYPGRRLAEVTQAPAEPEPLLDENVVIDDEYLDQIAQRDMDMIQENIDNGFIGDDLGEFAEVEYDDDGNEIRQYDLSEIIPEEKPAAEEVKPVSEEDNKPFTMPTEFREKMYFTLISSYLAKDDFAGASGYVAILKNSDNKYYKYYGMYTEALLSRKLNEPADKVNRKYSQAIAYFRNKSFADPKDTLAAIFRARLYAEEGKAAKAEEIANLLAEEDRNSVLKYMESLRS